MKTNTVKGFLPELIVVLFAAAPLISAGCGEGVFGGAGEEQDGSQSMIDGSVVEADGEIIVDGEVIQQDAEVLQDAGPDEPDAYVPTSCGFDYDDIFVYMMDFDPAESFMHPGYKTFERSDLKSLRDKYVANHQLFFRMSGNEIDDQEEGRIAHIEPEPNGTYRLPRAGSLHKDLPDIVIPDYNDNMPLFERATAWTEPTRCYETPVGVMNLTQDEAYDLYREIAELTTGVSMVTTPGVRSVVGLRRGYPGRLVPNSNLPNRFNNTIVLLWRDLNGDKNVREFPVTTNTGAYDFGWHNSSSLRANRRYRYINGWHRSYNALRINESSYLVWDDANNNGFWDSDRNGWLPPHSPQDHQRTGSAHNIHMGSVNAPLGGAAVHNWSAGCQVIPGIANWIEFITHAWTNMNDPVDYFLIDVRDIDHRVFFPCTPDGTHECPYEITSFPFSHSDDTSVSGVREFDIYNCSPADESGPEVVYFFTVDRSGTLTATVDDGEGDDMDVHLLDADDPNACLARAHISLSHFIGPGRYFIIVDTYVSNGVELSGPYTLHVDFD